MECAPNNSIIITIAIKMHGVVFNLTLTPETARIMENTRLFSKAGAFELHTEAYGDNIRLLKNSVFQKVNELFIKDLNRPSLVSINEYSEEIKPQYQEFLKTRNYLDETQREKVCSLFGNITLDKIFKAVSETPSTFLESCIEYIVPQVTGIYLISVHQKKGENNYQLIYGASDEERNMDLCEIRNLEKLSSFFSRTAPNVVSESSEYPSRIPYENMIKEIKKDTSMSEDDKERRIEQTIRELYEKRKKWSLTVENGLITSIKMSKLVEIIKQICGENCYINILDYSCNALAEHIPKEEKYNAKYFQEWDIEKGERRNWGGTRKRRKRRKKSILKRKSRKFLKKKTLKIRRK